MNREEAKNLLPVIQAFAEGKDVQWKYKGNDNWHDAKGPTWSEDHDWRIKPEPLECWVVKDCDGDLSVHQTKEEADDRVKYGGFIPYTVHHMREVIE